MQIIKKISSRSLFGKLLNNELKFTTQVYIKKLNLYIELQFSTLYTDKKEPHR